MVTTKLEDLLLTGMSTHGYAGDGQILTCWMPRGIAWPVVLLHIAGPSSGEEMNALFSSFGTGQRHTRWALRSCRQLSRRAASIGLVDILSWPVSSSSPVQRWARGPPEIVASSTIRYPAPWCGGAKVAPVRFGRDFERLVGVTTHFFQARHPRIYNFSNQPSPSSSC